MSKLFFGSPVPQFPEMHRDKYGYLFAVFLGAVLSIYGIYKTYEHIKYVMFGKSTCGTVEYVKSEYDDKHREHQIASIRYHDDKSMQYETKSEVSEYTTDSTIGGKCVLIKYLSYSPASCITDQNIIYGGILSLLIGAGLIILGISYLPKLKLKIDFHDSSSP